MISFLDTDLYKLTMGQVVFLKFPQVTVEYKFFNRDNREFPKDFGEKLKEKICKYPQINDDEISYLKSLGYFTPVYLEWLSGYKWNTEEVQISQCGPDLNIKIVGPWRRTIYWEVPLMASISALYFNYYPANLSETGLELEMEKLINKADFLKSKEIQWSDFGTRRRYSFSHHFYLLNKLRNRYWNFLGTSNIYLAKQLGFNPVGTMAHEGPMVMQTNCGLNDSNRIWLDEWLNIYGNKLNVMLPDTLTTGYFIKTIPDRYFDYFNGIRQDSGNPNEFIEKIVEHLKKLEINPSSKTIICSDSLDPIRLYDIVKKWKGIINVLGGIGTNITNNICGVKPLNIVIKATRADFGFGYGFRGVVKLSDNPDKATGNIDDIVFAKESISKTRF